MFIAHRAIEKLGIQSLTKLCEPSSIYFNQDAQRVLQYLADPPHVILEWYTHYIPRWSLVLRVGEV